MKVLITGGSGFIGTNLTEYLLNECKNVQVINVDIKSPTCFVDKVIWEECDILDIQGLEKIFERHLPDTVIHLAAETSCDPNLDIDDYRVNTVGSRNVFEVSSKCESSTKLIHTSTQFVNQVDFPLEDFLSYKPHTIYGESKIISEKELFSGNFNFHWIIIRPTNIWGKWHLRYPQEFWRVLREGKYLHPNKRGVIRSYGYVGNIADQLFKLINLLPDKSGEIFYVGDEPSPLENWVDGFSLALTGRKTRKVPAVLVRLIAFVGDMFQFMGVGFPITSSRYRSMTESNPAPMKKTLSLLGPPRFSLNEGINITCEWLKTENNVQKSSK